MATGDRARESCVVDIFGEKYNLGQEADTPFAYYGRAQFNKAYSRMTPALACKYFPASRPRPAIEEGDVPAVREALNQRLSQLRESSMYSTYLVNASKQRTYYAIERALAALKGAEGPIRLTGEGEGKGEETVVPVPVAVPEKVELTPDQQYLALINLTWHLLHPDAPWPDTLARVKNEISKNASVAGLIENIRRADAKGAAATVPIQPLNYFTRIESLAPMAKATTLEEAYAVAKSAAEADARKAALDSVTDNLTAIIAVLKAHGYMEKGVSAADLSGELIGRIGHTFDPVIAYLRVLYDPVFVFLEKAVASAPKPIPIGPIMDLIRQMMDAPDGVTPAAGSAELTAFMSYLAGRIDEHLAGADQFKRGQFYEMLAALPMGSATVTGPSKVAGVFPRSELSIKPWLEFDRVDGEGYKALVKAGIAAADMRAAYDAAVGIFNRSEMVIVSGATRDFPSRVGYEFEFGGKKYKLGIGRVLNRLRNYVTSAMLSMIVLIAFRAGLPGGAEAMGKNIQAADAAAKAKADAAAKAAAAQQVAEAAAKVTEAVADSTKKTAVAVAETQALLGKAAEAVKLTKKGPAVTRASKPVAPAAMPATATPAKKQVTWANQAQGPKTPVGK